MSLDMNVTAISSGCNLSKPILGVLFTLDAAAVVMSVLHVMSVKPPKKAANASDVLQWAKTSMGLLSLLIVIPLEATAFTGESGATTNRVAAVLLQHLVVDFYPLGQLALAVTRLRVCLCKGNADVLVTKLSAVLTLGLCLLPLGISVVLKAFISLSAVSGSKQTTLHHYCLDIGDVQSLDDTSDVPDQTLQRWYSLFVIVAFDIFPLLLTFVLYAIIQKHYRKSESNAQRRQTVSGKMQRRMTIVQHHRKTGRSISLSMMLLVSIVMLAWLPYVVLGFISWSDATTENKDTHHAMTLFCIVALFLISPIGEGMFLSQKRDNIQEVFKQLRSLQARRQVGVTPKPNSGSNRISVDNTIIYNNRRTIPATTEVERPNTQVNDLKDERKLSECSLFSDQGMAMEDWIWKKMEQNDHDHYYYDGSQPECMLKKVRFSTDLNIETAGSESDTTEYVGSHRGSLISEILPPKRRRSSTIFHVHVRGSSHNESTLEDCWHPSEYFSQSNEQCSYPVSDQSEYQDDTFETRPRSHSHVIRERRKRSVCRFCPQAGKLHRRASDYNWRVRTTPTRKREKSSVIHEEPEEMQASRRNRFSESEISSRTRHSIDIFQNLRFDSGSSNAKNCLPPIQPTARQYNTDIASSNLLNLFQAITPMESNRQTHLPQRQDSSETSNSTGLPVDMPMPIIKNSMHIDRNPCYDTVQPLSPMSYVSRQGGNRACSRLYACNMDHQYHHAAQDVPTYQGVSRLSPSPVSNVRPPPSDAGDKPTLVHRNMEQPGHNLRRDETSHYM